MPVQGRFCKPEVRGSIPLCSTTKDLLSSLNELSFSFYQQELAQFSTRKRTKILGL